MGTTCRAGSAKTTVGGVARRAERWKLATEKQSLTFTKSARIPQIRLLFVRFVSFASFVVSPPPTAPGLTAYGLRRTASLPTPLAFPESFAILSSMTTLRIFGGLGLSAVSLPRSRRYLPTLANRPPTNSPILPTLKLSRPSATLPPQRCPRARALITLSRYHPITARPRSRCYLATLVTLLPIPRARCANP